MVVGSQGKWPARGAGVWCEALTVKPRDNHGKRRLRGADGGKSGDELMQTRFARYLFQKRARICWFDEEVATIRPTMLLQGSRDKNS